MQQRREFRSTGLESSIGPAGRLTSFDLFSPGAWNQISVWSGWVGCTIGTPIFFLITSNVFEETMEKWRVDRSEKIDLKTVVASSRRSAEPDVRSSSFVSREELSITDSSSRHLDPENRSFPIKLGSSRSQEEIEGEGGSLKLSEELILTNSKTTYWRI